MSLAPPHAGLLSFGPHASSTTSYSLSVLPWFARPRVICVLQAAVVLAGAPGFASCSWRGVAINTEQSSAPRHPGLNKVSPGVGLSTQPPSTRTGDDKVCWLTLPFQWVATPTPYLSPKGPQIPHSRDLFTAKCRRPPSLIRTDPPVSSALWTSQSLGCKPVGASHYSPPHYPRRHITPMLRFLDSMPVRQIQHTVCLHYQPGPSRSIEYLSHARVTGHHYCGNLRLLRRARLDGVQRSLILTKTSGTVRRLKAGEVV